MSDFDIHKIAQLVRLELSPDEQTKFQDQVGRILDYMKQLDTLDVTGIEPMAHASPVFDVMREDESRPGLDVDEALANAPRRVGDQFHVPKVIEGA